MNEPSEKYQMRKPHYNLYKPLQKADAGAAFQFSYDVPKCAIFLEAAKQQGPKLAIGSKEQFDWKGKIIFKIGVVDISKLLLLFAGREKKVLCIHSVKGSGKTSTLELTAGEYNGKPNFALKLSHKADDISKYVNMFLTQDEIAILAHFVRESLTRMLGF